MNSHGYDSVKHIERVLQKSCVGYGLRNFTWSMSSKSHTFVFYLQAQPDLPGCCLLLMGFGHDNSLNKDASLGSA